MSKKIIALFWLLFPAGLFAQNPEFKNLYRYHFEKEKGQLVVLLRDSWLSIPFSGKSMVGLPAPKDSLPAGTRVFQAPGVGNFSYNHPFYLTSSGLVFTTPGTGMVYRAGADSIARIDRSFDHRAQTGCIEFVRHDTIWRHGGFSAWSARNVLTFFQPEKGEWDVLRPVNGEEPPPGLWKHKYLLDNDSLWVFGGYSISENKPDTNTPNHDVWIFYFPTRTWTRIGEISKKHQNIESEEAELIPLANGKALLFSQPSSWLVDFRNNEVTLRDFGILTIRSNSDFEKFENGQSLCYFSLYDFHTHTQKPADGYEAQLRSISLSDLTGARILQREPLLTGNNPVGAVSGIWQSLMWLGGITLIGVGVWFSKRNKSNGQVPANAEKPILTKEGLLFQNQLHPLDRGETAILELLLKADREIQTADLLDVIGRPELDYTHNLRVKNQMVEALNLKLRSILRISENPISILRSPMDKRIHVYQIKKDLFG